MSKSNDNWKTKKIPVALRFNRELLLKIDEIATKRGVSRNAMISIWCSAGIKDDQK